MLPNSSYTIQCPPIRSYRNAYWPTRASPATCMQLGSRTNFVPTGLTLLWSCHPVGVSCAWQLLRPHPERRGVYPTRTVYLLCGPCIEQAGRPWACVSPVDATRKGWWIGRKSWNRQQLNGGKQYNIKLPSAWSYYIRVGHTACVVRHSV